MCGVRTIFKVGGAQAIAAMAFGTESIQPVDKIVGPGNQYVTTAKRLVADVVDTGPPAGPSESIVLCDAMADPQIAAREWLVEAEHGPDSAALLVTDSVALADAVAVIASDLAAELPSPRREYCESTIAGAGGIVVTDSVASSIAFVNDYAPEHLRVLVEDPFGMLSDIRCAGEVLLGPNTSIAFGNYAIGVNAILPTGGKARTWSCAGVDDFTKRSSFAYVSAAGVEMLTEITSQLAEYEGFPAHAEAARYLVAEHRRRPSGTDDGVKSPSVVAE
jgi:histidinol dehydrogenase